MVQVIEGGNPFASLLGGGVRGFSHELNQGMQQKRVLQQIQAKEEAKMKQKLAFAVAAGLIPDPDTGRLAGKISPPKDITQELMPKTEQEHQLSPTFENEVQTKQSSEDPFAKAKAAALLDPTLAKIFSEEAKREQEIRDLPKKEYIKSEYKSLPKFMENIEASEDRLPTAEISIRLAEDAIEDPAAKGKWNAFKDFLADKTGYEGFRSAKGAELQSAIKQYFLGDLSSIKGGRPNQLIEKQLLDAYPKIGRDPIANQKILAGMKMQHEIAREKVRVSRELEEKYLSEYGHLPVGFQAIVKKQMKPIADRLEKQTIKTLDSLSKFQNEFEKLSSKSLKKGEVLMLSPDGEYLAVPKTQYDEAKKQGYIKLK